MGDPPPHTLAWPDKCHTEKKKKKQKTLHDLFPFPKTYRICLLLSEQERNLRHRYMVVGFRDSGICFKYCNIII